MSYSCFLQQLIYSSGLAFNLHICCWSYQQELVSVRLLNLISIWVLKLISNQDVEVDIRVLQRISIRAYPHSRYRGEIPGSDDSGLFHGNFRQIQVLSIFSSLSVIPT